MSIAVEKATAKALRSTLAGLIVTPGFHRFDRPDASNHPSKRAVVDQAWQLYTSIPHRRIDELEFKASLKRATFIDQYSVDTFLLAFLRIPF